jgi:septal ring factor EnvC (AmiA/AmiB activator)
LRNRAAAQESRDKKRKYVSEIEASNETLQQENCQLLKRLKTVESDNLSLHQRLEALTAQFAQMQQQLASSSQTVKHNNTNQPGVGFCQVTTMFLYSMHTYPSIATLSIHHTNIFAQFMHD